MMSRLSSIVLAAVGVLVVAAPSRAQVIFGKQVGGVTVLFQTNGGAAAQIATGLPANEFPALSNDARSITLGSPDPNQTDSTSTDLFRFDRATGQVRKLYDNMTTALPNGSFVFASPVFSGTSGDGRLVAFANQVSSTADNNGNGGGSYRVLHVVDGDDPSQVATAEIGQGNSIDYYESEFLGIAWFRSADHFFITPAYVPVTTNTGRQTVAAGLVEFGPDGSGGFQRVGVVTTPVVTDTSSSIIVQTHAFPAIAPDGQHLAFFRITYPDPLLLSPVSADLVAIDTNGGGVVLTTFNQGVFPLGVAWAADSRTLVFSIANQTHTGGNWLPSGDPDSAILRTVDLDTGAIGTVAGAPNGYFPSVVALGPVIFSNGFDG